MEILFYNLINPQSIRLTLLTIEMQGGTIPRWDNKGGGRLRCITSSPISVLSGPTRPIRLGGRTSQLSCPVTESTQQYSNNRLGKTLIAVPSATENRQDMKRSELCPVSPLCSVLADMRAAQHSDRRGAGDPSGGLDVDTDKTRCPAAASLSTNALHYPPDPRERILANQEEFSVQILLSFLPNIGILIYLTIGALPRPIFHR